jgi:hypothetical protein
MSFFKSNRMLVLILLITVLSGCGQSEPTTLPEPTDELNSPMALSSPLATPTKPQASPLPEESPDPTPLPPPPPSKGAVTGRIINAATGQRTIGMTVYLGTVKPMGSKDGNIVTMKENASPHTLSDADGYFAFTDIEPDTYALILWTPLNSIVVPDPDTGREFMVTVQDGQITELGDVVSNLP